MSTSISNAYDALVTKIEATLSSHNRLTNPYRVEQNISPFLTQGYGVRIEGGVNSQRLVSCKVSIERSFTVILSRKFYAKEYDASDKATTEKQLFEDQIALIVAIENDSTLNGAIAVAKYVSDSGIQFVDSTTEEQFMYVETTFSVEYFETIG